MNKQSFLLPNQGSTIAQDVDTLFYFILIASIVIFAIVVAGLIFLRFDIDASLHSRKKHTEKTIISNWN